MAIIIKTFKGSTKDTPKVPKEETLKKSKLKVVPIPNLPAQENLKVSKLKTNSLFGAKVIRYDDPEKSLDARKLEERYIKQIQEERLTHGLVLGGSSTSNVVIVPYVIDSSYQAILDQATLLEYTKPSANQQLIQNQLVLDLKNAGIWNELDVFYNFANDGSQEFATLNWKDPSTNQCTLVNSPTWTSNVGFEGNGSSAYINTNWDALTDGVNYTQNSSSVGAYVWNDFSGVPPNFAFGSLNAGSPFTSTFFGDTSFTIGENGSRILNNAIGFTQIVRTGSGSGAVNIYINGTDTAYTGGAVSSTMSVYDFYILAANRSNSPLYFSDAQVGAFFTGGDLTSVQASFDTGLRNYIENL